MTIEGIKEGKKGELVPTGIDPRGRTPYLETLRIFFACFRGAPLKKGENIRTFRGGEAKGAKTQSPKGGKVAGCFLIGGKNRWLGQSDQADLNIAGIVDALTAEELAVNESSDPSRV